MIASIGSSMPMSNLAFGSGIGSAGQLGEAGGASNGAAASVGCTNGQHSARNVVMDTQATSVLSSFQAGMAGEDTLKMMMALIILDALFGEQDKDKEDPNAAALALLGAAAGSASGGFLAVYTCISQADSDMVAAMNQSLAGTAGYVPAPNAAAGGSINLVA